MYGQLSDLLGSGVPLLRALKSLVKSTVNKRLADVLREFTTRSPTANHCTSRWPGIRKSSPRCTR